MNNKTNKIVAIILALSLFSLPASAAWRDQSDQLPGIDDSSDDVVVVAAGVVAVAATVWFIKSSKKKSTKAAMRKVIAESNKEVAMQSELGATSLEDCKVSKRAGFAPSLRSKKGKGLSLVFSKEF